MLHRRAERRGFLACDLSFRTTTPQASAKWNSQGHFGRELSAAKRISFLLKATIGLIASTVLVFQRAHVTRRVSKRALIGSPALGFISS